VVLAEAASGASAEEVPAAVAPAATGDARGTLSQRQIRRIAREVDGAEEMTGLQIAVYLGPTSENSRAHAESMLAELGHTGVPAVLLLIAPEQRRLEIVTSPAARQRVSDRHAALAAASMTASFAVGDVVGGVCIGVQMLARYAGPPASDAHPEPELPDLLSGYGE
jgi:uncharacterized membrane protein YgcG